MTDRIHIDRLSSDDLNTLYAELDETRRQLALSRAGASQRETLLTEARDALEEHGGHGDAWPDIVAPIHELTDRLEQAEAAVQRVRDLHRPWTTVHGTHCNECSHLDVDGTRIVGRILDLPCPTIRALDARPEPAADTDTAPKEPQ